MDLRSTRDPFGYTTALDPRMDILIGMARFAPLFRPDASSSAHGPEHSMSKFAAGVGLEPTASGPHAHGARAGVRACACGTGGGTRGPSSHVGASLAGAGPKVAAEARPEPTALGPRARAAGAGARARRAGAGSLVAGLRGRGGSVRRRYCRA